MVDRDIALLLIGAGIALFSSMITAVVQHFLSLRADRIKRERDQQEQRAAETKQSLASGKTLSQLEGEITKLTKFLSIGIEEEVSVPEDSSEAVTGSEKALTKVKRLHLSSRPIGSSNADDKKKDEEKRAANP